jgi:hypothetical protein
VQPPVRRADPLDGIEHLVVRTGVRAAGIEVPVEQLGTRAG